ncbi:MAG: hypothetical protein LBK75_04515, partial [Oscillospiraceae bacterium]|nr:hypothetical protein [Oscillospiraceae bacterium]
KLFQKNVAKYAALVQKTSVLMFKHSKSRNWLILETPIDHPDFYSTLPRTQGEEGAKRQEQQGQKREGTIFWRRS